MKEPEYFYTSDRQQWRNWLLDHFEKNDEIWFVFPTKESGEPGLSYNDAVEEALCFGWIDGRAGTLDETHQLRRFTPRRKDSPYSQPNIERLIWLDAHGLIHPKIRPAVEEVISRPFVFPEDILARIREDEVAWKNYQMFPESYRRIRIAYIDAARKRPKEFEKRLLSFLRKTRNNRLIIGYGGIDKYYGTQKYSFLTLRDCPDRMEDAVEWFHRKWGVPKEAYTTCMKAYLDRETEYGWYLCLDGDRIAGGMGVIENDFHDRKDLAPNVCAVYTEETDRGRGIAGRLLNIVVEDMRAKGISPLYLVTDHSGFYERYGWEFFCLVQGDGEQKPSRMYIHR